MLSELQCVPCRRGQPPLDPGEVARYLTQLPGWSLMSVEGVQRLQRVFKFKDFAQALSFTDQVGALAEKEGHHPALLTEWGQVTVSWWTHVVGGLHTNDFILAARTDELYDRLKS